MTHWKSRHCIPRLVNVKGLSTHSNILRHVSMMQKKMKWSTLVAKIDVALPIHSGFSLSPFVPPMYDEQVK